MKSQGVTSPSCPAEDLRCDRNTLDIVHAGFPLRLHWLWYNLTRQAEKPLETLAAMKVVIVDKNPAFMPT